MVVHQVYSSNTQPPQVAPQSQISPHAKVAPMYNAAPKYSAPPQVQQPPSQHQMPAPHHMQSQHHHQSTNHHHQNNSGYHTQSYGGPAQQLQPQPVQPNQQHQNYNHIRHSVLQSSVNPSGAVQHPQQVAAPPMNNQQHQQKYYDQFDNYSRPNVQNAPAYNANNNNKLQHSTNNNASSNAGYNNHQHHQVAYQQQQAAPAYNSGYSSNQYNGAGGIGQVQTMPNLHYGNGSLNQAPAGGGIGKISDYDPLSDGPRKVIPASNRNSATLIYNSSDRGSGKCLTFILTPHDGMFMCVMWIVSFYNLLVFIPLQCLLIVYVVLSKLAWTQLSLYM